MYAALKVMLPPGSTMNAGQVKVHVETQFYTILKILASALRLQNPTFVHDSLPYPHKAKLGEAVNN